MKQNVIIVVLVIVILFLIIGWRLKFLEKSSKKIEDIRAKQLACLPRQLYAKNSLFEIGNPIFLRVIKEELILELWMQENQTQQLKLYKTYPILAMSGQLGPKLKEGDCQAPEGFYSFGLTALNPKSRYYLSFNIGYPNLYDQAQGRTGSFIMVHGKKKSVGCLAMGDPAIEEIYILVEAALLNRQSQIPIEIYPFRMTEQRMAKEKESVHWNFWQELKFFWETFEFSPKIRLITVKNGRYSESFLN